MGRSVSLTSLAKLLFSFDLQFLYEALFLQVALVGSLLRGIFLFGLLRGVIVGNELFGPLALLLPDSLESLLACLLLTVFEVVLHV